MKAKNLGTARLLTGLVMFCAVCMLRPDCAAAQLPAPDLIIEKHIEALGGPMFLRSLDSFKLKCDYVGKELAVHWREGTLSWVAQGGKYQYWLDSEGRFWQRREGHYSLRRDLSTSYPTGFIQLPVYCLDWIDNPSLEKTNLGQRDVGEQVCWCIQFEVEGQQSAKYYFDCETGLLSQIEAADGSIDRYRYSELNGVTLATELSFGMSEEVRRKLVVKSIELDPEHEGIDFQIPKDLAEEFERLKKKKK